MFTCDVGALNKITHFYSYKVRIGTLVPCRLGRFFPLGGPLFPFRWAAFFLQALQPN